MLKILICLILMLPLSCVASNDVVQVLAKGDELTAPNSLYSCWIDYSGPDRNILYLRIDSKTVLDVWHCVRSLGVSWSPDSKYLAIEDYLDGLGTAVLVFRISASLKSVSLIFQTPYSNSVFVHYQIESWVKRRGKDEITITKLIKKSDRAQSKETIDLDGMNIITQTIYTDVDYTRGHK